MLIKIITKKTSLTKQKLRKITYTPKLYNNRTQLIYQL